MAKGEPHHVIIEKEISKKYKSLLEDKVSYTLINNSEKFLNNPNDFWLFLSETFLTNWDFELTSKALVGNEIVALLDKEQVVQLSKALGMTLLRYAFESLSFYTGQSLTLLDVKINDKKTFAWIKVNMESPKFPDIHLDILLRRRQNNEWKGVDFRFKGITYVNLKKNSFRDDFNAFGFAGMLKILNEKNQIFFRELCAGAANYMNPHRKPCIKTYD